MLWRAQAQREFFQRIAMERRGVVDVVLADQRVVHGEAVMMLAGDDDVLHPGVLRPSCTQASASNFTGLNCFARCSYSLHRNLGAVHDPLADAGDRFALPLAGGDRIQAPVDEQAELGVAEPFHFRVLRCRRGQRLGKLLRGSGGGERNRYR